MGVGLRVREIPPYKQIPADHREKQIQQMRAKTLREEAESRFGKIIGGSVRLTIEYKRRFGKSDASNIIGGIADILNKIAYHDDRQIVEIHYRETKGTSDEYDIIVEEV